MLQWRPRLVVLVAVIIAIAVTAAEFIDVVVDGLTW